MSLNHLAFRCIIKIFAVLCLLSWNVEAHFATEGELIDWLNSQNLSWKAGPNPRSHKHHLLKKKPKQVHGPVIKPARITVPDTFDSRLHWKHCTKIIGRIRDQGDCGSCWAAAGASMFSDRTCIGTNASTRVHLSTEHLTTCCAKCLAVKGKVCEGGDNYDAANFWVKYGIVTGGEVNSKEGCKPYSRNLFNEKHVRCVRRCTNKSYPKKYNQDKHKGKSAYYIYPKEKYIMREIFRHGPVTAGFYVYEDFDKYRKGVYRFHWGKYEGAHAVKIIGWGTEDGEKYWLIANSYGTDWGLLKGYFKFVRGENHCSIEQWVVAGRMSELSLARDTLAKANRANKRNLFSVERLLVYGFCFWILKGIL